MPAFLKNKWTWIGVLLIIVLVVGGGLVIIAMVSGLLSMGVLKNSQPADLLR